MTKIYRYTKLPAKPTKAFPEDYIYQPLLPITIVNLKTKQELPYIALLDSGAEFCLFHGYIGEAIGLNVRTGKQHPFSGICSSGSIAYIHQLNLYVEDVGIETLLAFSYEIEDPYRGIIGQREFFEFFEITFNYNNLSFTLSSL